MSDKPAPLPDVITDPYWRRLAEGSLSFQHCLGCGARWLPASPLCPHCWSPSLEWLDSSGKARLLSWTTYHRAYHPAFAGSLPYVVGFVELAEGPRLMAGVRTREPGQLSVGTALRLKLEARSGGFQVPVFEPAGKKAAGLEQAGNVSSQAGN